TAEDGGLAEHAVQRLGEAREPPPEHLADAFRNAHFGNRSVAYPAALAASERARLDQVTQGLLDEERIPLGLPMDRRRELESARRQVLLRERREERPNFPLGESPEQDALVEALAPQLGEHLREGVAAVEVDVTVGAEDEQPALPEAADEV